MTLLQVLQGLQGLPLLLRHRYQGEANLRLGHIAHVDDNPRPVGDGGAHRLALDRARHACGPRAFRV